MNCQRLLLCLTIPVLILFLICFFLSQSQEPPNLSASISSRQVLPNSSFPLEDLITRLPGANFTPNYRTFSGYLTTPENAHLFYLFFESASDNPLKDPLILWLNGGPGCSSLLGAFTEVGPLLINDSSIDDSSPNLLSNPYAWNRRANLLFLETPPGTGFSYQISAPKALTDQQTAYLNYEAIVSFYGKFPALRSVPFYLSGESYASRYIAMLSAILVKTGNPPDFRGLSLWNPLLRLPVEETTIFRPQFYDAHGIDYISLGNFSSTDPKIWIYNIHKQCQDNYFTTAFGHIAGYTRAHAYNSSISFFDLPQCGPYESLMRWANQPQVWEALHIRPKTVAGWNICNRVVYSDYQMEYRSLDFMFRDLIKTGIKILIASGDADYVCTFTGAQDFVENLGFDLQSRDEPLYFNETEVASVWRFERNLTFVRIFNAGHMAPMDAPGAALKMMNEFLLD